MRIPILSIAIGIATTCLAFDSHPQELPESSTALKGIQRLYQGRTDSIRSLYYESTITRRNLVPDDQIPEFVRPDPLLMWMTVKYGEEGDQRGIRRQFGPNESDVRYNAAETWNSTYYKSFDFNLNSGAVEGELGERHGFGESKFQREASPLDLALLTDLEGTSIMAGRNLAAMLARSVNSPEVTFRRESENGRTYTVIVIKGTPAVWLDTELGYAVRKYREPIKKDGVENFEVVNEYFEEVFPGTWLPTKSYIRWTRINPETNEEVPLTESEFNFSLMKVNSPLPPETFDLQFPEGGLVKDYLTGYSFVVGDHGLEKSLSAMLGDFEQSNTETSQTDPATGNNSDSQSILTERVPSDNSLPLILLAALTLVATAGAVLLFKVSRNRS